MWLSNTKKTSDFSEGFSVWLSSGAEDEIRTRDPHLGKVMLYH